jgi:hypothetical protein
MFVFVINKDGKPLMPWRAKTFLIIGSGVSSPCLKAGVSTPSV